MFFGQSVDRGRLVARVPFLRATRARPPDLRALKRETAAYAAVEGRRKRDDMASRFRPLRLIAVGGCAAAIAVAPNAGASPTPDSDADTSREVPAVISGGPVPTMNGVPCVAGHLGTCIGFAQNQPRHRIPRATVGHSPTVRR